LNFGGKEIIFCIFPESRDFIMGVITANALYFAPPPPAPITLVAGSLFDQQVHVTFICGFQNCKSFQK
jgi:hypothetical protein